MDQIATPPPIKTLKKSTQLVPFERLIVLVRFILLT